MSRIRGFRSSAALTVAVVALVAALGGGAVAGVTVSKLNGKEKKQVKRLSKKQAKKLDKKLELTPGPQGEQGLPGAQGLPGPQGTPGKDANSQVVTRYEEFSVSGMSPSGEKVVKCAAGERALGGGIGFTSSPGSQDAVVYSNPNVTGKSFPDQGDTPDAWAAIIYNSEASAKTARAYVVCGSS